MMLDLDVLFYPTPARGPNWRPKAKQLGGRAMFPYMVDDNTGVAMYESDDIIRCALLQDQGSPFQGTYRSTVLMLYGRMSCASMFA